MRAVRYLEEAREEYLHEVSYFSAVSPRLAAKFDRAVEKAESLAAEFAEAGMPYKHGTRRVIPGKFKFSIVYLTLQEEILVIAVAPFKRRQGYWRPRLSDAPRPTPRSTGRATAGRRLTRMLGVMSNDSLTPAEAYWQLSKDGPADA